MGVSCSGESELVSVSARGDVLQLPHGRGEKGFRNLGEGLSPLAGKQGEADSIATCPSLGKSVACVQGVCCLAQRGETREVQEPSAQLCFPSRHIGCSLEAHSR